MENLGSKGLETDIALDDRGAERVKSWGDEQIIEFNCKTVGMI